MKIRVEKKSWGMDITFPKTEDGLTVNPSFSFEEIEKLCGYGDVVAMDGMYTMRKTFDNYLYVWKGPHTVVVIRMDVVMFFQAVMKIPQTYKEKRFYTYFDTASFTKPTIDTYVSKTWLEIATWIRQFEHPDSPKEDSAIHVIIKAKRRGVDMVQLKRELARFVGRARIFPDSYSEENISFYWNGRNLTGGNGMNGGLLYYNGRYNSHS